MDPKELRRLLQLANQARRDGQPLTAIEDAIRNRTGGQINSYTELANVVRASRDTPKPPVRTSDLLISMGEGATFRFLDEIIGGMAAAGHVGQRPPAGSSPSERFMAAREPVRQQFEQFQADQPGAAFASELYGGLGVPGIGVGGAAARGGGGLLARLATSAGVGAGAGALAGAGGAEDIGDIPGEAAAGAVGGGVLGLGFGAGAAGLGAVARPLAQRFAPNLMGRQAGEQAIRETMERAGMTPGDVTAGLGDIDPRSLETLRRGGASPQGGAARRPDLFAPVDLDPQFGRLLREVINEASGPIGPTVRRMKQRVLGAGERLAKDLGELTGFGRRTMFEAREAAQKRLDDLGNTVFSDLRKRYLALRELPQWNEMQALFQTITDDPNVAPLWRKVRPKLTKDEPIGFGHLHALRREMADEARAMRASGRTEGSRQMFQLHDQLTDIVDNLVPGFRAANRQYAQTARTVEAFDLGAQAWRRGASGDEIARELTKLLKSAGDEAANAREAYRHGMVDEAINRLRTARRGRDVASQEFLALGPARMEALRAMFRSERDLREMIERAIVESAMAETRNLTLRNSSTTEQVSDLMRSMRTTGFWGPVAAVLNFLARPSPRVASARSGRIAELLTGTGSEALGQFESVVRRGARPRFPPVSLPVSLPAGATGPLLDVLSPGFRDITGLLLPPRQ